MKVLLTSILLLVSATLCTTAAAQTAPASGSIQYEGTRRIDQSQVKIVMNGQEIRPGSPEFPTDLPDVRTFGMTLRFAGGYAKEEREGGGMVRTFVSTSGPGGGEGGAGAGPAPRISNIARPFEETVYLNLKDRAYTTVLTLKKDEQTTAYRADAPFAPASAWQFSDQTKKIAGYTCRKATVPYKKENYTVWVTTDLPFTYSPIKDLMPEKGVVLAVEGRDEQYRASKVDTKPVKEADVRPDPKAQTVTTDELKDLRSKAMADFRQKLTESLGSMN